MYAPQSPHECLVGIMTSFIWALKLLSSCTVAIARHVAYGRDADSVRAPSSNSLNINVERTLPSPKRGYWPVPGRSPRWLCNTHRGCGQGWLVRNPCTGVRTRALDCPPSAWRHPTRTVTARALPRVVALSSVDCPSVACASRWSSLDNGVTQVVHVGTPASRPPTAGPIRRMAEERSGETEGTRPWARNGQGGRGRAP